MTTAPGRALLGITVALLLASGCTLLVDTSDLSGGANDDRSLDGAMVGDGDGPGPSNDGQAPADVLDGSRGFCPRAGALLCDDFDGLDAALPGPWQQTNSDPATTFAASTTRYKSAPRSLGIQTPAGNHGASLGTTINGATGAELAFDLFIDTRGGNLSVAWFHTSVGDVFLQPMSDTYTNLTETHLVGGMTVYASSSGPPIASGGWSRITLDVDFPTKLAVVKVDGQETVRRTLLDPWAPVTSAELWLGVPNTSGTTLYYDNVTITTR